VRGVADAFDLSKEHPKTIERYDTAALARPEAIDKKWNNHKHYADNAKSLGKLLLLARRLCERGCGFVTVTTNFVWDMHADNTMPLWQRVCATWAARSTMPYPHFWTTSRRAA
jgi:hypothetical protein